MKQSILAAIAGIILGLVGSKYVFVGSALSLIPWAIVGGILGYLAVTYKQAITNGVIYGFCLAFSFMVFGYAGKASLISRVPFFAILGIIGALCGLVLTLAGQFLRAKLSHNDNHAVEK